MTLALSPVLVTPPAPIVSLLEAKLQARVTAPDEDALILSYIDAATQHFDGWDGALGRALGTQVWRQDYPCFTSKLRLPLGPVQTVDAVEYWDSDNADTLLDVAGYALRADALGPFVEVAADWPGTYTRADAVRVTFTAGYGVVPEPIRQAILLLVAHWVNNREAAAAPAPAELPFAVEYLIASYRRMHA